MQQNRHTCAPKTSFTYQSHHHSLISNRPKDKPPLQNVLESAFLPAFLPSPTNHLAHLRPASLPPQQVTNSAYQSNPPIRIDDRPSESQRMRRNKIFDQRWSPLKDTTRLSPYKASGRVKVQQNHEQKPSQLANIAVQCDQIQFKKQQPPEKKLSEELVSRVILNLVERNQVQKRQIEEQKLKVAMQKSRLQQEKRQEGQRMGNAHAEKIDERLYQRVIERILENGSANKKIDTSTPAQPALSKKDQQIAYLKMEVERLQRCDRLNKENESLYKRLVTTLKQQSVGTSFVEHSVDKKTNRQPELSPDKTTPLNYFSEIKHTEGVPHIQRQSIIINKKGLQVVSKQSPVRSPASPPKQFIRSPSQPVSASKGTEHLKVIKHPDELGVSNTLTFNKVHPKVNHSRRVRAEQWVTVAKVHRNVNQSYDNRVTLGEAPITMRLGEMNRQLERSMNTRPRSVSKPRWNPMREGYEDLMTRSYAFKPRISIY